MDLASCRLKRRGTTQLIISAHFQKPAFLILVQGSIGTYGTGIFHLWKSVYRFCSNICSYLEDIFFREHISQQNNAKVHTAGITTALLHSR